jgi:ferritin-like metal-binding protein YciE
VPIANPRELFLYELGDIYDAEHRFLEGQQEMAQQATDQKLKDAIEHHFEQTQQHILNLEEVYNQLDHQPERETCQEAQALVSEAQEGIQEAQNEAIRDCLIDAAVIKVEHYEIASYRSLVTGALLMERPEVAHLLQQNLDQEEETAQTAEQSARELLERAQREAGTQQASGEQEEDKGLMDKAKDKLTGE